MTYKEIARRLLDIAGRKPTDIWRELHALAGELEQRASEGAPLPENGDIEALVRATQPPTRRPGLLETILRGRRR